MNEQDSKTIVIRLELPASLYDEYEHYGNTVSKSAEEVMIERLQRCRDYLAIQPLYFNDEQRHELEVLMDHLVRTPEDALAKIRTSQKVRVGPVSVEIPVTLLDRVKARTAKQDLRKILAREAVHGLEYFVGIR